MITDEQYKQAFDALYEWEQEIAEHNSKILSSINVTNDEIVELLDYADVKGKMSIVESPRGENQNETYKSFTRVFVDQWSTGTEGDSFAGSIYAEFAKGKWLSIPFEC